MAIDQLHNILETLNILKMFKHFVCYENNKILYLSLTISLLEISLFLVKILKDLLLVFQSGI